MKWPRKQAPPVQSGRAWVAMGELERNMVRDLCQLRGEVGATYRRLYPWAFESKLRGFCKRRLKRCAKVGP